MATLARRIDLYQLYLSRTIAVAGGICALSVFLYVVFLMLAVEHTAKHTALQNSIDSMTIRVSALETNYLKNMRSLTPARAAELGFVAPPTVTPVFAHNDGRPLSLQ